MATKKDLVEAYAFSRRRLVTAFVSGAPGGREVEPARPGRSIVGGLALAVLLLAGAAIAGVFGTNVDPAWAEQPGLIVSKEEAAVYVITEGGSDPVLHPVLNITSAKLILGSDQEPQVIPDDYIDRERIGNDVGILGAPSDVPDVERLLPSGWTACAEGDRLRLSVTEQSLVDPADSAGGLLVRVGRGRSAQMHVVARGAPDAEGRTTAYSYPVPDVPYRDALLGAVGLPPSGEAKPVSQAWLDLFPTGGELSRDAFDVRSGPAVDFGDELVDVGRVATAPRGSYLATARGIEQLTPFAETVYASAGGSPRDPVALEQDPPGPYATPPDYSAARWPGDLLTPVFGEACVRLLAQPGEPPRLELVQDPTGEASTDASPGQSVAVDDGAGGYVLSGGWQDTDSGQPFVFDAKGSAYPLTGADTPDLLGYGEVPAPVVPDSWVELFDPGVELSRNAALCEPGPEPCG